MNSQVEKNSGNTFIDENHDDLLDRLDDLVVLVHDKWDSMLFHQEYGDFVSKLEQHFSHEEIVLKGAGFRELNAHVVKHRELSLELIMLNFENTDYDGAVDILCKTRALVHAHELLEDQRYWAVFDGGAIEQKLDNWWSADFKTGDKAVDQQHKALMRYICRFMEDFQDSSDRKKACMELGRIKDFSEYHFNEEEQIHGINMKDAHMANHRKLLTDLDSIISEVRKGKYNVANIGSYLKFWLQSHISEYDIPSVAKGRTH